MWSGLCSALYTHSVLGWVSQETRKPRLTCKPFKDKFPGEVGKGARRGKERRGRQPSKGAISGKLAQRQLLSDRAGDCGRSMTCQSCVEAGSWGFLSHTSSVRG